MNQLVDKLRVLEAERCGGKADDFAELLGIPASAWSMHKAGTLPIRFSTLKAIAKAFPDLKDDIFDYLVTAEYDRRPRNQRVA